MGSDRLRAWGVMTAGLAILSTALASCDSGANGPADRGGAPVEIPPGDVQILGTSDALAVVIDLEVLPDGTVWALNSLPPFFIGFDAGGRVIAQHGSEGGGPEEYGLPAGFVTGGLDGEVWVLDGGRHSLIRISTPEDAWTEIRLPAETLPPGTLQGGMDLLSPVVRTARLDREVVLPRSTGTLAAGVLSLIESILKADLVRFDPATGTVDRIVSLGDVLDDPFDGFEATEGGFPLWRRLWATCGPDEWRVYDRERNQLRGFDRTGFELSPFDLPAPTRTEATPEEFVRSVFPLRQAEATGGVGGRLSRADSLRISREMEQEVSGSPSQLGAYLPRYVDVRCSEDGTVWMQPFDVDAGGLQGSRLWYRVPPQGGLQRVVLPPRFDALRFTADRVWGVQRDAFDVASIAWAPLPGA